MIFYRYTRQTRSELVLNVPLVAEGDEKSYWTDMISGRLQYETNPKIEKIFSYLSEQQDLHGLSEGLRDFSYLQTAQSQMLKEYVFEQIRFSEFPEKPSRKSCIFAFSAELDPILYIQSFGLESSQYHVIEIETVGTRTVWHQANRDGLNCNHMLAIEMENEARAYWSRVQSVNYKTEILLSGRYKINRIIWSGSGVE